MNLLDLTATEPAEDREKQIIRLRADDETQLAWHFPDFFALRLVYG